MPFLKKTEQNCLVYYGTLCVLRVSFTIPFKARNCRIRVFNAMLLLQRRLFVLWHETSFNITRRREKRETEKREKASISNIQFPSGHDVASEQRHPSFPWHPPSHAIKPVASVRSSFVSCRWREGKTFVFPRIMLSLFSLGFIERRRREKGQ